MLDKAGSMSGATNYHRFFRGSSENQQVHKSVFPSAKQNRQKWTRISQVSIFFLLLLPCGPHPHHRGWKLRTWLEPGRRDSDGVDWSTTDTLWKTKGQGTLGRKRVLSKDKQGPWNTKKTRQRNGNQGPGLSVHTHTLFFCNRLLHLWSWKPITKITLNTCFPLCYSRSNGGTIFIPNI